MGYSFYQGGYVFLIKKLKKLLSLTLVALIGLSAIPITADAAPKCYIINGKLSDPVCAKNKVTKKTLIIGKAKAQLRMGSYGGKKYVWGKVISGSNTVVNIWGYNSKNGTKHKYWSYAYGNGHYTQGIPTSPKVKICVSNKGNKKCLRTYW